MSIVDSHATVLQVLHYGKEIGTRPVFLHAALSQLASTAPTSVNRRGILRDKGY